MMLWDPFWIQVGPSKVDFRHRLDLHEVRFVIN